MFFSVLSVVNLWQIKNNDNRELGDSMEDLKKLIREVPDFPKPGILFYDITTLLKDPKGLKITMDRMIEPFAGQKIDTVIGIEARGFIFAPLMAYHLDA